MPRAAPENAPLSLVTYQEDSNISYAATHPESRAVTSAIDPDDLYPPTVEEERRKENWKAGGRMPGIRKILN